MTDNGRARIIQGIQISPGLAEGIVHIHRSLLGPIDVPPDAEQHNVEEEFSRLGNATVGILNDLLALSTAGGKSSATSPSSLRVTEGWLS